MDSKLSWKDHIHKKKKTNGSEGQALILVNREKVHIIVGEQTFNIQNYHQANLDL
jgi:hypothetical protein